MSGRRVSPFGRPWLLVCGGLWLLALAIGFRSLWLYMYTPGPAAQAPLQFPEAAGIALDPRVPTLIVFGHPFCPCTSATFDELDQVLAHSGGRLRATLALYEPRGAGADWRNSPLRRRASGRHGLQIVTDVNAVLAERFGVRVSGEVLLYDPAGRLRFSGGITGSRGHAGDNDGLRTLRAVLADSQSPAGHSPVFGCLIRLAAARQLLPAGVVG